LKRVAQQQAFNARLQNITCPFEKEKEQVVAEFADPRSNLSFADAWLKIDEVEQRQSDQTYSTHNPAGNNLQLTETDDCELSKYCLLR
jgi:hypothetical protein